MIAHYTTKDIASLFSVSQETVKNWSREFAVYLSATATPPAGTKRVFTDEDTAVFALIADYKSRGLTYTDAHIALQAGQRGEVSAPTAIERLPVVVQDMILHLRSDMDDLRKQLEIERDKTSKALGKVELLTDQLAQKEELVRSLYKQLARHEARAEDTKNE